MKLRLPVEGFKISANYFDSSTRKDASQLVFRAQIRVFEIFVVEVLNLSRVLYNLTFMCLDSDLSPSGGRDLLLLKLLNVILLSFQARIFP